MKLDHVIARNRETSGPQGACIVSMNACLRQIPMMPCWNQTVEYIDSKRPVQANTSPSPDLCPLWLLRNERSRLSCHRDRKKDSGLVLAVVEEPTTAWKPSGDIGRCAGIPSPPAAEPPLRYQLLQGVSFSFNDDGLGVHIGCQGVRMSGFASPNTRERILPDTTRLDTATSHIADPARHQNLNPKTPDCHNIA